MEVDSLLYLSDEELIRKVDSDPNATASERSLARRLAEALDGLPDIGSDEGTEVHTRVNDITIAFTPALARKLETHYRTAVAEGRDEFEFEGHVLVVNYAKYLLEFLQYQFGMGSVN